MIFEYKVYLNKIGNDQLLLAKRLMPIIVWLKKRYNINSETCNYNHGFKKGDKEKKQITIQLNFINDPN